ncbi:MAG: nucleoside triphosphate pyrophosphatase [Granulosicoccus sp.]
MPTLILASQSRQRLDLLKQIGFAPTCLPADIDETPQPDESPAEMVMRLACVKARACSEKPEFTSIVAQGHHGVILAADTVIDLDGQVLGKPRNRAEGIGMLLQLSDREHQVHSGVCVLSPNREQYTERVTSTVRFARLTRQLAENYWDSGEPEGKAGSYAIQAKGAQFVVHLSGSYSNVVGLPLYETTRLLARTGLVSL